MPLYEYQCKKHGVFEVERRIVDLQPSEPCPSCDKSAGRILSLTQISHRSRADRRATERNEKSRFEPKVVQGTEIRGARKGKPRLQASHGRPWALEHS